MSATAGPNFKKLVVHKMSLDAVPPGGGIKDGLLFFSDKDRVIKSARAAHAWASMSVAAVRQAAKPNPWRDAPDEEIAGEILRQIEAKKKERKK